MVQGLVAGTTHSAVTEAGVPGMVERRCEAYGAGDGAGDLWMDGISLVYDWKMGTFL